MKLIKGILTFLYNRFLKIHSCSEVIIIVINNYTLILSSGRNCYYQLKLEASINSEL